MYSQPQFIMPPQECLTLIENQPFGLLSTCRNGQITQAFLPLLLDKKENCLYGHLAKQNKQINELENSKDLVITFQGDHAYISPNWYDSEQQVPTWNYQAIEVRGVAKLLNSQQTLEVITKLSEQHEAQFKIPWTMSKLSTKKTEAMLRAIVGFRIEIIKINGISKMSQNKNERDRSGVVKGLTNQPDQASKNTAKIINKIRG